MKTTAIAAITILTAAAAAACGHGAGQGASAPGDQHDTPPSCDAIVAHLAVVFEQHDLAPADRADLIQSCERENPSAQERRCVLKADTPGEIDACGRELAAAKAKDAAVAPADPRDDLLALGQHVARYRTELGEPPPPAGPTPPAGSCCAAPCAPDASQWTGPWQLVRFGLDHGTRWSFEIARDEAGAVTVRALGCPGAPSYQLELGGAAPQASDIHATPAGGP